MTERQSSQLSTRLGPNEGLSDQLVHNYDHLFRDEPESGFEFDDRLQVLERSEPFTNRERKLFAPLVVAESSAEEELDYSYLFNPEYEPSEDVGSAAVTERGNPRGITEKSIAHAANTLAKAMQTDSRFEKIIDLTVGKDHSLQETVAHIRTDADLRLALGRYLVDKVDALPILKIPDRVSRGLDNPDAKNPNYAGYDQKMSSAEYVAILALSMLDGTFRHDLEDKDEMKVNASRGEVETGQHRATARMLLDASVR